MKFQIEVIKSKIHRVTVTQADLNYVGSITIDEEKKKISLSIRALLSGEEEAPVEE